MSVSIPHLRGRLSAADFADHGTVPVVTSYDEVMAHCDLSHLDIPPGFFEVGPLTCFKCPLLTVN